MKHTWQIHLLPRANAILYDHDSLPSLDDSVYSAPLKNIVFDMALRKRKIIYVISRWRLFHICKLSSSKPIHTSKPQQIGVQSTEWENVECLSTWQQEKRKTKKEQRQKIVWAYTKSLPHMEYLNAVKNLETSMAWSCWKIEQLNTEFLNDIQKLNTDF